MDKHDYLKKQVREKLDPKLLQDPSVQAFIAAINDSYITFEKEKQYMTDAYEFSQVQYQQVYQNLLQSTDMKQQALDKLKEAIQKIDRSFQLQPSDDEEDFMLVMEYLNEQIEKKQEVENNLSWTLKLVKTLLSNLYSGIMVEDENRKILFINQIFCDILTIPYPAENLVGADCSQSADQNMQLFVHPKEFRARLESILAARKPVRGDELQTVSGKYLQRDYIPIFIHGQYKGHFWEFTDVTERKTNELEWMENRQKLNTLFEISKYMLEEGEVNKTAERILSRICIDYRWECAGWWKPDLKGEVLKNQVFVTFDKTEMSTHYRKIVATNQARGEGITGKSWQQEKACWNNGSIPAENGIFSFSSLSVPVYIDHELYAVLDFYCNKPKIADDNLVELITAAARQLYQYEQNADARLQLINSERNYRTIVEKATEIIYKTNRQGRFIYVNPVAERITEYSKEELFEKHFRDLIRVDYQEKVLHFYAGQIHDARVTSYHEFPIVTKSGQERWIGQSVQYSPLEESNYEFTALAIDITERKNFERNIFLQEEKYRNIIANMNLGLLEVDIDGTIQYSNQGFTEISGYAHEELIGKKATDLFIQGVMNVEKMREHSKERSKGVSDIYELSVKNKRGELRWWLISGAPHYNDAGELIGSIGIHLDITDQKRLEQELEVAKVRAEESSKAKEVFLANMSHEIRTPLNAIIGMNRELGRGSLDEKQRLYLGNASTASQHLLSIINNILDISKIEAGEFQLDQYHFNLNDTVHDVAAIMVNRAEEKGLKLYTQISEEISPTLIGDSSRIRQILLNLVGNAIKFTDRGNVSMTCNLLEKNGQRQKIRLTIADTGIGMNQAFTQNIFNKFSQEDKSISRKQGGTGLGMAITYELVQLMQGTIQVKSQKDIGTTIDIELILPVGDARKVAVNSTEDEVMDIRDARILLVEDNEFNRLVATSILKHYACEVVEAVNGLEALKVLQNESFDVILMDLQMPVMDGFEATKVMRTELGITTPIIALTANAFKTEIDHCMAVGMNDCVTKPYEEKTLVDAIYKNILQGKSSNNKELNAKLNHMLYNLNKLIDISRGDKDYVRKMIQIFIDQSEASIRQIREAYQAKDLDTVYKTAHRIKPSIDSLEITTLTAEIRAIELLGKEGVDSEILAGHIDHLENVLTEVIDGLKKDKLAQEIDVP
jgi:PAS domain S-box-containing protein